MKEKVSIVTRISEGSRSEVYLASNEGGEPVIYKKIPGEDKTELYKRVKSYGFDCLPKLYTITYSDGYTELVEEYVEGTDLGKKIDKGLSMEEAELFSKKLMEAIRDLHSMTPPLIHRDIKPENILISNENRLMLIDLEAAREYSKEGKEQDTVLIGTRGYAAPEQFGFNQTDVRSDVYSTGIVINQIFEKVTVADDKKESIKSFITKATMFDPEQRFSDMDEMIAAFDEALKNGIGILYKKKGVISGSMKIIAGCIAVLLLTVLLIYLIKRPAENSNTDENTIPAIEETHYKDYEILPKEYEYKPVALKREEIKSADTYFTVDSECVIGAEYPLLRFLKDDPRAILFYSAEFENISVNAVELIRYTDNGAKPVDRLKLMDETGFEIKDGCVCIFEDTLSSLNPGIYILKICFSEEKERDFYLQVCDKGDNSDEYGACVIEPVQYYSRSSGNDIFFNTYNTFCEIKSIYIDGKKLSDGEFLLTLDKKGAILKGVNLEKYSATDASDVIIEMTNGKKAYGKIVYIS